MNKNLPSNQNMPYRSAPSQGGPQRIQEGQNQNLPRQSMPRGRQRTYDSPLKIVKERFLKRALPYLLVGGSTGMTGWWAWLS